DAHAAPPRAGDDGVEYGLRDRVVGLDELEAVRLEPVEIGLDLLRGLEPCMVGDGAARRIEPRADELPRRLAAARADKALDHVVGIAKREHGGHAIAQIARQLVLAAEMHVGVDEAGHEPAALAVDDACAPRRALA